MVTDFNVRHSGLHRTELSFQTFSAYQKYVNGICLMLRTNSLSELVQGAIVQDLCPQLERIPFPCLPRCTRARIFLGLNRQSDGLGVLDVFESDVIGPGYSLRKAPAGGRCSIHSAETGNGYVVDDGA